MDRERFKSKKTRLKMRNSRNPGKPEFSDAIKKAGKCGYPGAAAISFC